jgi:hypothetical protein
MSDETQRTSGDATYRQQRDEIAKRNVEAHRRGQAERKTRDRAVEDRDRMEAAREAAQLHALNDQISKRKPGR